MQNTLALANVSTRQQTCADVARGFTLATIFCIPFATSLVAIFFHLAVLFSLLSGHWSEKWTRLRNNPIVWLFALLFILYLIGATYSSAPAGEIKAILLRSSKYFLAIFLFPLFTDERWRYYALYAFLASITVMLALLYANQFALVFNWAFAQYNETGRLFKHSINTGFLLVMFVYLLALLLFKAEKPRWLWVGLFSLAMVNLMIFSTSRTAYVLFCGLSVLLGWQIGRWRGMSIMLVVGTLLVVGAYQFSPIFNDRVSGVVHEITEYQATGENTSTGGRLRMYEHSWTLIKAHPIFGTGSASFMNEYEAIETDSNYHFPHPHNDYFYMAIEFGVFGVLMLIALYLGVWRASFALSSPQREWAQALVFAMAVGGIFNCFLLESVQRHLFVIFMAVAFATYQWPKRSHAPSRK